jgi:hypothetical protein
VLVRLTAECNRYRDAQPFYTVAYGVRAGGRAQVVRHTPTWDRAHTLLTWFLRDVTDPVVLGTAPPLPPPRGRRRRVQYSERPDYGGRQLPRLRTLSAARGFGARL